MFCHSNQTRCFFFHFHTFANFHFLNTPVILRLRLWGKHLTKRLVTKQEKKYIAKILPKKSSKHQTDSGKRKKSSEGHSKIMGEGAEVVNRKNAVKIYITQKKKHKGEIAAGSGF